MYSIINMYINKLTKDDILNFATKKGANLSPEELDFTYTFIKKNWKNVLDDPSIFDINRYKSKYSEQNFLVVKNLYQEYYYKFLSLK